MLRTRKQRVDQKVLLDSGATECFVHHRTVQRLGLETRKLMNPRSIQNVDGTPNKAGQITEAVELLTNHCGTKTMHTFFVADIGPDDFILGYPFLKACAPIVNWAEASLADTTTLSTKDADQWRPQTKATPRRRK